MTHTSNKAPNYDCVKFPNKKYAWAVIISLIILAVIVIYI